jgi:hypothetical protein
MLPLNSQFNDKNLQSLQSLSTLLKQRLQKNKKLKQVCPSSNALKQKNVLARKKLNNFLKNKRKNSRLNSIKKKKRWPIKSEQSLMK